VRSRCFAACRGVQALAVAGHWDSAFKLVDPETARIIQQQYVDGSTVTCVAVSEDARWLVTGSKSTAVFAWSLHVTVGGQLKIVAQPSLTYHGHDDEVISCAVSTEHDLLVSGSKASIVYSNHTRSVTHTIRIGWYLYYPYTTQR
jgi:WD40 repeat protein